MIKVLIVDDHTMVRQSIGMMLEPIVDIDVIGDAKSGEEALSLVKLQAPDVVLMDVRMPGIGGLEATRRLLELNNKIRVIGLTGYNDGAYPGLFMRAGASGYLTKDTDLDDIQYAIRQVFAGNTYLSDSVPQHVVVQEPSDDPNPFNTLSERERQVALLIAESYNFDAIASRLNLAKRSIRNYRFRILDKLQIESDVELALLALRFGMVEPESTNNPSINPN